jgi:predicted PurR-regulated permease PerM
MSEEPSQGTNLSRYAIVFFIVCFLLVGYALFLIFSPFFSVLVWASLLTVVFYPVFRKILKWTRGRRTAASLVTCLLILLLIVLPVTSLAAIITQQSVALYYSIESSLAAPGGDAASRLEQIRNRPVVQWMQQQAGKWFGADEVELENYARQIFGAASRWVVSRGPSLLAGAGGMLFGFLLMFITMFFLFRDGAALMEMISASNPLPERYESEIIRKFQDVSYATFFGSILTAMVQGLGAALLFWALGVPSPLFWGAVVALVSLVPVVGAFLVWVPMASYFYLVGQTTRGIVLLAIGGIVVSSIDNVLKPMIIQGRTNMHPLLVFFGVLGGLQVFGFLGILLGPLTITVFLSFLNFYRLEFGHDLKKE